MNKLTLSCAILVGAFLLPLDGYTQRRRSPSIPVQPSRQPEIKRPAVQNIRVEDDGRISADVSDSPIQDVLKELAERTGVVFEVRTQEDRLVSIHLNRVPLQEAIERITAGDNIVFLYDDEPNAGRIKLVRVLPRTPAVPQPGIVYLGTGAVTRTGRSIETPEQALQVLAGEAGVEDREKGIAILVHARSDTAVKALMNCLSDPAPEIRIAAIEGLASMGAHSALPAILKSLRDRHSGVRQSAVTAVALLGDVTNVPDLRRLSRDRDAGVAAAVDIAIRKLSAGGKLR